MDYKGEFLLGNKRYCCPLTVTDHASRYLLLCDAMESVKEVDHNVWLLSFMDYVLGYIDLEEKSLQPLANPFEVIKV